MINHKFSIKCIECNDDIFYKWKKSILRLDPNKCVCKKCKQEARKEKNKELLIRNCPKCQMEITYRLVSSRNHAEEYKKLCRNCARAGEFYSGKQRNCPNCNEMTVTPKPAKFSLEDKYLKYRLLAKKNEL